MTHRYHNLLSPIQIGNVVLKNRMISSNALPHYLQGPERYPAEPIITYYAHIARNGAAIVTCPERLPPEDDIPEEMKSEMGRMPFFNINDAASNNYFSQLADAVHFYGSKLAISIVPLPLKKGYGASDRPAMSFEKFEQNPATKGAPLFMGVGPLKAASEKLLADTVEAVAQKTKKYKDMGFDMVSFHLSYRGSLGAQLLSPLTNKRTDKYGGSLENRARFTLDLCARVKELCGRDFLIEVQVSGEEAEGGITLDDTLNLARLLEGKADIMQLREGDCGEGHPTGYDSVKGIHNTLKYAEAVKKVTQKILVAPVGGFQDPSENESYIADEKTDMIAMARAFICDPEYGKKLYEGRGEDVVPCIRCNKCHASEGISNYWVSVCSVNPLIGIEHRLDKLVEHSERSKKVAVIGGGVAGMKAAIVAAQRGHKVTLFEKDFKLGGKLKHSDVVSFKWPIRDFKDYLIKKLYELNVDVRLNTTATPELIKENGFDAVIAALGAKAVLPDIPGNDRPNVFKPDEVYGNEEKLGKRVVVVGGASTGTETGIYLAEKGMEVTVLSRNSKLAQDIDYVHYYENIEKLWKKYVNFNYITNAKTTEINEEGVRYIDKSGAVCMINADSVILCGGVLPMQSEAVRFYDSAIEFSIIGDCENSGNIQKCMRSAFSAASVL